MLSPGKGEGDKKRLQLDLIRKGGGKGGGVAPGREKIPPHSQVVERGEEGKGFLFQLWGGRKGGEEESPLLNMQSLERKQAY